MLFKLIVVFDCRIFIIDSNSVYSFLNAIIIVVALCAYMFATSL